MTGAAYALIYLTFCVLVGLCGTQRRLGFLATFIASIIVTPVVVLVILLLTAPANSTRL
ncbi:hypothetical protein ACQR1I_05800 [Bradyrhizobium sp. HKCCYLS2038]|uniref:hypothetical protein n=1 Tax=unclassified Bradyrhizobium TaxID=2631580 RepID=UPI003EBAA44D